MGRLAHLFGAGRSVRRRTRVLGRRVVRRVGDDEVGAQGGTRVDVEVGLKSAPTESRAKSAPAQASEAPARASGHTNRAASRGDYTVRGGDTLSGIAERQGTTWRKIYAANRAVIGGDPDLIMPGQRLDL